MRLHARRDPTCRAQPFAAYTHRTRGNGRAGEVAKLDPGNPLNKSGQFLTERGVEVCYRLFDIGMPRYSVKKAMGISYGAATHRFHAWEKLGGKKRKHRPLD